MCSAGEYWSACPVAACWLAGPAVAQESACSSPWRRAPPPRSSGWVAACRRGQNRAPPARHRRGTGRGARRAQAPASCAGGPGCRRRLRREWRWTRWPGWRPWGQRSCPRHQPLGHQFLLVARRHDVLAWFGRARRSSAAANPTHDRRKGTPGVPPTRIRGSANPAAMREPASWLVEPRLVVAPEGIEPRCLPWDRCARFGMGPL